MNETITTVRQLMEHYIENHEFGIKQNTIDCWFKPGLSKFEKWLERPAMISDLSLTKVNSYIDWLKLQGSSGLVRSRRGPIMLFVRYATDLRLIQKFDGTIRKIRIVRKPPVGWTLQEVQTLLNLCLDENVVIKKRHREGAIHYNTRKHNTLRCGTRVGLFLAGVVATAWDSTLRLGDVLELKWSDLTIDEDGWARAQVVMSKTSNTQPITLSPGTVQILRDVQASRTTPSEKCLDWEHRPEKLYDWIRAFVRESKIRPGTLRRIRRGSASAAERLERGAGKSALGHRSDWTSWTHYLDPTIVGVKDIAKPDLFAPKTAAAQSQATAPSGLTGTEAMLLKLFREANHSKREEIMGELC